MEENINMESLKKDLLADLKSAHTGATTFEKCRPLIQEAINEGASKRFIWQWLYDRQLFPFTYTTFLQNYKKQKMKKQTPEEIASAKEKDHLRALW